VVRVTTPLSLAIVLGLGLGVGLWLIVSTLPRLSRPRLMSRVAPYVVDVSSDARELLDRRTANPLPVFGLVTAPVVGALASVLDAVFGGAELTARRLTQSGSPLTVEAFRAKQLVWGAAGVGAGVLVAIAVARTYSLPLVAEIGIVGLFGAGAVVVKDWLLQRAATRRIGRMAEELPTVLEFLTLSLSAGEGILDAIRRVSRISHGELSRELAKVTADVATGMPLAETLAALAATLQLAPFTRCVLRAQAQDVRDDAKRDLLETAGKKEVAMLMPLVFLILPTTIAFAIYPAVLVLQVGL
jgi:tight adherence protein C